MNQLQPQYQITASEDAYTIPDLDLKTMMTIREALLPHYQQLPNTFGIMGKGYRDGQDEWRRVLATAGAWGLSADENAMYAISSPQNAKANVCYKADFDKVSAKDFYSVTAYSADKFLMTDQQNSLSSNRNSMVLNPDGGFTAYFGGPHCEHADHPNFIQTPEDGWDTLLRAYRPDVKAFKAYATPSYEIIQ